MPSTDLGPSAHHLVACGQPGPWRWLRLNMHPDGGIARLRVYGDPVPSWDESERDAVVELSALRNGGRARAWNDAHYGDVWALLAEGRGRNMGDGWETARRRGPGHDWAVIALGRPGILTRIDVDTTHFKGNYPDSCSIDGAYLPNDRDLGSAEWRGLVGKTALQADHCHSFTPSDSERPLSHVRLNIFPDGGVARLRVFGRPEMRSE